MAYAEEDKTVLKKLSKDKAVVMISDLERIRDRIANMSYDLTDIYGVSYLKGEISDVYIHTVNALDSLNEYIKPLA